MTKDPMIDATGISTASDAALPVASYNFESRKIQIIDAVTLLIKPSVFALVFCLLFALPGIVMVLLWMATTFTIFDGPGSFPMLLLGLLFTAAGMGFYYSINEQAVLNRESGIAFIRSWRPSVTFNSNAVFRHIKPQEISAIQIVSRVVRHRSNRSVRRSRYTEYQVNVCLVGDERENLFITLKAEKSEKTAKRVAAMFQVPLRDDSSLVN